MLLIPLDRRLALGSSTLSGKRKNSRKEGSFRAFTPYGDKNVYTELVRVVPCSLLLYYFLLSIKLPCTIIIVLSLLQTLLF